MEWNTLLLWIAGSSAFALLFQAFRASPRSWGWIGVAVTLGIVTAAACLLAPQFAGFIAGGIWAVFIVAPSLLQRSVRQWTMRQNYTRASRFAMLSGILHPFDGVPQQTKLLRAMAMAERGDTVSAIAMLGELETTAPPPIARSAAIQRRRFNQDWAGVITWIQSNVEPGKLLRDISMLPTYVRALGETGQLSEMLRICATHQLSAHPMLMIYRNMCRMYAFSFCGRFMQVTEMFGGPLSQLPAVVQGYWIATAKFAAGMIPEATRELHDLQSTASPGFRVAIETRLANPPPFAEPMLTNADLARIDLLAIEYEHEQRFAHWGVRESRPWITYILIAANVIVFALEWAMDAHRGNWLVGGTQSDTVLHRLGAMNGDVLHTHEYYRLFTGNFLHNGYAHILMNMLALWFLGPFVERSFGRIWYLLLYLVSGVAVMVSVLFFQLHHWMPSEELVGASGAIMAIIGATAAILLRGWLRDRAPFALRRFRDIALILLVQVAFDHFTPEVSGAAHAAGMVWGFVLGGVIPLRSRSRAGVSAV